MSNATRGSRWPWLILICIEGVSRLCAADTIALFAFDDVNFAYSISHFDIRDSQPHPPGYPVEKLRGPGNGTKYRLTVEGPGVTPDVSSIVPGLHDFDPKNPADVGYEKQQNAILDSIIGSDKLCRTH